MTLSNVSLTTVRTVSAHQTNINQCATHTNMMNRKGQARRKLETIRNKAQKHEIFHGLEFREVSLSKLLAYKTKFANF
jgi:hypothetical protein